MLPDFCTSGWRSFVSSHTLEFFVNSISVARKILRHVDAPYVKRGRLIYNEEEPFVPPYSEGGEHPFQREWQEAHDSIDVPGHTCPCLVASSLRKAGCGHKATIATSRRTAAHGGHAAHGACRSPVSRQFSAKHISALLHGVGLARSLHNERECIARILAPDRRGVSG